MTNYMKGLDLERREAEYEKKIAELARIPEERKKEKTDEEIKTVKQDKTKAPVKRAVKRKQEPVKGKPKGL